MHWNQGDAPEILMRQIGEFRFTDWTHYPGAPPKEAVILPDTLQYRQAWYDSVSTYKRLAGLSFRCWECFLLQNDCIHSRHGGPWAKFQTMRWNGDFYPPPVQFCNAVKWRSYSKKYRAWRQEFDDSDSGESGMYNSSESDDVV